MRGAPMTGWVCMSLLSSSWQHIPAEDTLEALKIVFFFQLAQAALDRGNALCCSW